MSRRYSEKNPKIIKMIRKWKMEAKCTKFHSKYTKFEDTWYEDRKLGATMVGAFMAKISCKADLSSVRATTVSVLTDRGISRKTSLLEVLPRSIMMRGC